MRVEVVGVQVGNRTLPWEIKHVDVENNAQLKKQIFWRRARAMGKKWSDSGENAHVLADLSLIAIWIFTCNVFSSGDIF